MAVTQRKDGTWAVSYRIEKKQLWEYYGKGLQGETRARERNRQLKEEGKIGQYNNQENHVVSHTFATLAEEYLKAKALELPKTSIDNLVYKLMGVILPELGNVQATRLTPDRLRDYIRKRMATPVYKKTGVKGKSKIAVKNSDGTIKNTSKSTIHRELSDIQAIMNWSVAENLIPKNPIANFKKPARDDEIILPPDQEEIKKIIEHAAEHLKRALIISFFTGLRPGASELFCLRWGDINFDSGIIHVISAKKGGIKDRLIPLHPEFQNSLGKWKDEDLQSKDFTLQTYIIRWQGQPVKSVKKSFLTAKKKAGITRRLRLYDFRHAFATAMLKNGGDLKSTSEMLGHTRTDTTSRIYQHTDADMHRENINRLPGLGLNTNKIQLTNKK